MKIKDIYGLVFELWNENKFFSDDLLGNFVLEEKNIIECVENEKKIFSFRKDFGNHFNNIEFN